MLLPVESLGLSGALGDDPYWLGYWHCMARGRGVPGSSPGMSMWDLMEGEKFEEKKTVLVKVLPSRCDTKGHPPTQHRRVPYRKVVALVQQGIADRTAKAPYVEN